jgi:signal-transduction protein with cAMP-binding, CBS, and nucleotidyltransferase domain
MIEEAKILRGLNGSTLFKSIPDQDLISISAEAQIAAYQPDQVIVNEGEPSDSLFIIINGIVTVKKIIANHPDKVFCVFVARQHFWGSWNIGKQTAFGNGAGHDRCGGTDF